MATRSNSLKLGGTGVELDEDVVTVTVGPGLAMTKVVTTPPVLTGSSNEDVSVAVTVAAM